MNDKPKSWKVVPGVGDLCHRCRRPTLIIEHVEVTERHLAQPYYYRRWFRCETVGCRTNVIMPARFKIEREAS